MFFVLDSIGFLWMTHPHPRREPSSDYGCGTPRKILPPQAEIAYYVYICIIGNNLLNFRNFYGVFCKGIQRLFVVYILKNVKKGLSCD